MEFVRVFHEAFRLLRDRPVLFLPRIVMILLWSGLWILLFDTVLGPGPVQRARLTAAAITAIVLIPVQIWMYSAYFIVVQQDREGDVSLLRAFRDGISRIPAALAAFTLLTAAFLLAVLPGIGIAGFGLAHGNLALTATGLIAAGGMAFLVFVLGYFTPTAAVLKTDEPLTTRLRHAVTASTRARRYVVLVTLLSFSLLALLQQLHSTLRYLGIIAFLIGRLVSAVLSVYVLLLNPELYMEALDNRT